MGWVRDIWRIPDYVAAANGDLKFEEAHVMLNGPDTERPDARPPRELLRLHHETTYHP